MGRGRRQTPRKQRNSFIPLGEGDDWAEFPEGNTTGQAANQ